MTDITVPHAAASRPARLIARAVLLVLGVLTVISAPAVTLLYLQQMSVLDERLADEGEGILSAYIAQTQDSIEKGQPRTFQRVMDNIARLDGVVETALYAGYGLQTYRSGEVTVGKPFVRGRSGELINPNVEPYQLSGGRYLREGWDRTDASESPALRGHIARHADRACAECHYSLPEQARFGPGGRAHVLDADQAHFYYRIPVEPGCVSCHTHWTQGEAAGFLGVTIATAGPREEVVTGIRRFVYVLLLICAVVLIATGIVAWLYGQLVERGRELAEKSGKLASLLDNSDQGFLSFDDRLHVDSEYSRECIALFGREPAGESIVDLLYRADGPERQGFGRNIGRILDEPSELKRDLYLSLMPKELCVDGKYLQVAYRLLEGRRVMLVLSDVTHQRELEEQIRLEQGRLKLIVSAAREPADFFELLDDYNRFEQRLPGLLASGHLPRATLAEVYRQVHTFKGLFSQSEFLRLPARLHALESLLAQWKRADANDTPDAGALASELGRCREALEADLEIVREALGSEFFDKRGRLTLSREQVARVEALAARLLKEDSVASRCAETRGMLEELKRLRYVDLRAMLASYPAMVQQLAERLDKAIHAVAIDGDCVRVDPDIYQPFVKSLVHLFRNCVDHGIEDPEERLAASKDETGSIRCAVRRDGERIELRVSDDGRGIDLEAVRRKAIERGLYTESAATLLPEKELLQAVFADELSTRTEVSELSGRGIGLAAVKAELDRLGGTVTVASSPGAGTTFRFDMPYIERHG